MLYYAFVPRFDPSKNVQLYNGPAGAYKQETQAADATVIRWVELQTNYLQAPYLEGQEASNATGGLVAGGRLLTTGGLLDGGAFLTCFYFSGVTFTTLGYGDISPQGIVRLLAMLESGVGAFLMALFVYAYTRRDN